MEEEWLDVVNDEDEVIGRDLKSNKSEKRFLSRNVAVYLQTKEGHFVMVQRAAHKKIEPLKFDLSACGHVQSGETYDQAARRELLEEVGVHAPLQLIGKRRTSIPIDDGEPLEFLTSIYHGVHNGPFTINEESADLRMMTFVELQEALIETPDMFCGPFLEDFAMTHKELLRLQKRFEY